jgi:isoleucyl-tRNA synthetase
MRLRQPLLEAVVHFPGDHAALGPLLPLLSEELNVKRVIIAESAEHVGRWRAKPNFKVLGPKLGGGVKDVATALGRDDGALAGRLAAGESVELTLDDGSSAELGPLDVDLAQEKLEGWGVGSEGGITVALELDVTTDLRREGLARDVIRLVQDARKAAGLDVSDRIALGIGAMGEVAEAMRDDGNRSRVTEETLATVLNDEPLPDATYSTEADLDGDAVTVTLRRT